MKKWTKLDYSKIKQYKITFKETLEKFKNYKIRICLLGGEPGLIKNLDDVINEIKKYPNFVCSVLSNSFVRKRYPHILEDKGRIFNAENNLKKWTDVEHNTTYL